MRLNNKVAIVTGAGSLPHENCYRAWQSEGGNDGSEDRRQGPARARALTLCSVIA